MIRELAAQAARKISEKQKIGHLGCVLPTGEPYIVPVNFLCQDEQIYFHSLTEKKLNALCENGKIRLQVEKIESPFRWQSVMVTGEFEEMKKTNVKIKVMQEAKKKL
jgi:uncharacterized protein